MLSAEPQPQSVRRFASRWILLASGALVAGVLATSQAAVWLGQTPALLLLAAVVAGAFFVVFAFLDSVPIIVWPVLATGGYLIQIPRTHPVITFDRVWIGGMLAFIVLTPRPVRRSVYTRPLILGLVWLVASFGVRAFITDANISGPVATWVDAILLPTILFVACERYCLSRGGRTRQLLGALMIAGGVLAVIGIAERIFGFELATITGGSVRFDAAVDQTRISGPYPAPEPYALALIICFATTLYWISSRKPGTRQIWPFLLVGLQIAAIALVLFRAAWIGALLVVIASIGIRPGRLGRTFLVAVIVAAFAFAATSQLQQNKTFATRTKDTTNIYGRLATYKQGLQMFRSAPLFGVGVNRYHVLAEARPPETFSGVDSVTYPHSSYIGLLAEQGLVGLLPLLFLSYAVWRLVRGLRAESFRNAELVLLIGTVAGAALAYLVMSLTLTMLPYEPSNAFFAVLLGAASARLDMLSGIATGDESVKAIRRAA